MGEIYIFGRACLVILLCSILFVSFSSIGSVCASDVELNDTVSDFNSTTDLTVNYDRDYNSLVDLLKSNNGTIRVNNDSSIDPTLLSQLNDLGFNNNSFILISGPDFYNIYDKISNAQANDIIVFDGNFTQEAYGETIHIDKPLKFFGNNNYLNVQNITKIFSIESDNILFINLNIINSQDMELDKVTEKYKNVTFIGCQVYNVWDEDTIQQYDFNNKQFFTTHKVDISSINDRNKLKIASKTFYDNLVINFKPGCIINIDSPIYDFIWYNCSNLYINGNGAVLHSKYFEPFDGTPSGNGYSGPSLVSNVNYFLTNDVNAVVYNITLEGFNGAIMNKGNLKVIDVTFKSNHCYLGNAGFHGDCISNKGILTSINSTYKDSASDAIYCYSGTLFSSINDTFIKNKANDIYLCKVAIFKFYNLPNIKQNYNSLKIFKDKGVKVVYRNSPENIVKNIIINNTDDLKKLSSMVEDIEHYDSLNVIINNSGVYKLSNDIGILLHPLVDLNINGNNSRISISSCDEDYENHFIANSLFFNCVSISNLYLEGFNTAITNWGEMFIVNCTFNKNRVEYTYYEDYGGAIYNAGYMVIDSCIFTNNYAKFGGAIYNAGNLILTGNNIFKDNDAYYDDQNWFKQRFSRLHPDGLSGDIYNEGQLKRLNCNSTIKEVYNFVKEDWNWKTIVFQIVVPIVFVPLGISLSFVPLSAGIGWAICSIGIDVINVGFTVYNFASTLNSYLSYKSLGGEVNENDDRYLSQILPTLIFDGVMIAIATMGIMAKVKAIYDYNKIQNLLNEINTNSKLSTEVATEYSLHNVAVAVKEKSLESVFGETENGQVNRINEVNTETLNSVDPNKLRSSIMNILDKQINNYNYIKTILENNGGSPEILQRLSEMIDKLQACKNTGNQIPSLETSEELKKMDPVIGIILKSDFSSFDNKNIIKNQIKLIQPKLINSNQFNLRLSSFISCYKIIETIMFFNENLNSPVSQMSYGEPFTMVIPK